MSGAKVHTYCGTNFQDLTNILNELSYDKMISYIEKCIEAREQDSAFHEKKLNDLENEVKQINRTIITDTNNINTEQTQKEIDSGYIKYLENSINFFFNKRNKIQSEIDKIILSKITHLSVIRALKLRLSEIIKYYKSNNIKPVLYLPKPNFVFDIKYSTNKTNVLSRYIINVPTKSNKSKKIKKKIRGSRSKGSKGSKGSIRSRGSRGSIRSRGSLRSRGKK
jgi:hypothetical protein